MFDQFRDALILSEKRSSNLGQRYRAERRGERFQLIFLKSESESKSQKLNSEFKILIPQEGGGSIEFYLLK